MLSYQYSPGYKVGRVDQAETALGAEMRLAAAKSKGKVSEDKGKDKIVRRCVGPSVLNTYSWLTLLALISAS